MPLTGFQWDSVTYFEYVELMIEGHFIGFSWLPPGYIFISYLISKLSDYIITHIIVQNIVLLFACFYLIVVSGRYYGKISYLVTIALCFLIIDDFAMALDTHLLTEAFYKSAIISACASIIWSFNSMSKKSFVILGIVIFIPAILRPNGLYVFYLIPVVLFFIYLFKNKLALHLSFLIPIALLSSAWAILNGFYNDTFLPGYPTRDKPSVISSSKLLDFNNSQLEIGDSYKGRKGWRAAGNERIARYKTFYYCNYALVRNKRDFYFENLTLRHFNHYSYHITDPASTRLSNSGRFVASQNLRKTVTGEMFKHNNPFQDNISLFSDKNKHYNDNKWLASIYVLYRVKELLVYNFLYVIWFYIIFFVLLFHFLKQKLKNKNLFILLSIMSFHLVNVIFLTIINVGDTSSSIYRYVHPTEFIVFLTIALSFTVFNYKPKFRYNFLKNVPQQNQHRSCLGIKKTKGNV